MKVQMKDIPKFTDTPVLTYCRKLINEGFNSKTKLEVYRGEVLALTISSIEYGSKMTIKETKDVGPIFVPYTPFKMGVDATASPSPIRLSH